MMLEGLFLTKLMFTKNQSLETTPRRGRNVVEGLLAAVDQTKVPGLTKTRLPRLTRLVWPDADAEFISLVRLYVF